MSYENHMARTNIVPVDIERKLYERLTEKAVEENTSIRKLVNEKLMMLIEKDDFLSRYFPFIQKIAIDGNVLVLKDNKLKQYAEITKKNNKIYCDLDESTDCVHTQFALSLLEIGKLAD